MAKKLVGSSFLFLLLSVPIWAESTGSGLDDLLSDYRHESDLSKQTKKESAGSSIIYTRERLEKMQAYNLRDILKTIPIFTMQEAATGQVSLAKAKGSSFNSQFLKLYINDHEVGSIGFGSAMKMWGFLDITYIDHIEIYQVGSSVMAGDEPPGIVVRLYSKDSKHDEGGAIQAMGGTHGSKELSAQYAHKGEKYSSFIYADSHQENRDPYYSNRSAEGVDRDFDTTNFFASLSGEDFTVDIAQFSLLQDRFLGSGLSHTPLENINDMVHRYIIGTKYFQNKTLKLRVAYDDANHKQSESDPSQLRIYNANGSTALVSNWFYDKSESILDAVIDKQFVVNDHDTHVGVQTKFKKVISNSLITDGNERVNEISGPTQWDIYSAFISDDYTINENNLIFSNIKLDHYDRNGGADDFNDYVLRLGYIYNDRQWMWKTFGARTYGYPVFMQSTYFPFYTKSNINLKQEERIAASTEIAYKTNTTDTNLRFIYNTSKNGIALQNNAYVNTTATPDFFAIYAGHEVHYGRDHTLNISAYYGTDDMPLTQSSTTGAMVQLFDTFGEFDLFNELIYRKGYTYTTASATPQSVNVASGYDYTLGITYHATDDLNIFIKGENLLNKAITTPYPMTTYVDYITPFDRAVRVGLKYVF